MTGPAPLVLGVIGISLDDALLEYIPDGMRVRLDLGDHEFVTDRDLRRAADASARAEAVEVMGRHPRAVQDVTRRLPGVFASLRREDEQCRTLAAPEPAW